ncbi:Ryncolin-2 [Armadillidium vulgare]|nr:Ryncolin-2 [Armadillidium vulgare]
MYQNKCCSKKTVKVFCDQETDGFGNLSSEFWLGLDNIHSLVSDTLMELRVDLEDYEGSVGWAKYEYFYISDENGKYQLDLGDYYENPR